MKASELRGKSDDELNDELLSLRKEAFNLRMQKAMGTVEAGKAKGVRRDIARVKTIQGERIKLSGVADE